MIAGPFDPLSAPLRWYVYEHVEEPSLSRSFPARLQAAGFDAGEMAIHTIVDTTAGSFGFQHVGIHIELISNALYMYDGAIKH